MGQFSMEIYAPTGSILSGNLHIALAMLVALLTLLDIVGSNRPILFGLPILSIGFNRPFLLGLPIAAIGCSMIWAFNIFGALPQLNTTNRPDLRLSDAERKVVWHIGENAPLG
jgi:hypothetical protein